MSLFVSLSDSCAIVGIGQTPFTRGTDKSTVELHLEAALEAIADAGLTPKNIDGVMPNELAGTIAEDFTTSLGIEDLAFTSTIRNGGSSFLSAMKSAALAIHGGVANNVLLVAGRRGYSQQRVSHVSEGTIPPHPVFNDVDEFERIFGNTAPPQWFAPVARRHMYEYGTTSEQFGAVAVTCRKHANANPRALMYGKTMNLEQHQASFMISDPFRLFDCCLETDGATAIVISSKQRARDMKQEPVGILGIGEGHGSPPTAITQKPGLTSIEGLARAGKRAYSMADLQPQDIDCVQLYDAFTSVVIISLEDLGFCERGEGGSFVEGGSRIQIGGQLPLNTSGGLLSEGHCSGANLVSEAVRQLRGEVDPERQVNNCERVLVSGEGHFHEGSALILGSK